MEKILLKGVNQHVIEIKNTESIYFERAILFVRPHCSDLNQVLLRQQSQKYLSKLSGYSGFRENERKRRSAYKNRVIFGLACGGVGIAFGAIVALILKHFADML